ncbi:amidase family protein, partial [Acinetobacter baumannii]
MREVVGRALDAAESLNETLNAILEIDRQGALSRAEQLDQVLKEAPTSARPSLFGVPIAIKDNICVRGMQTSCGSRILGDYHPPYEATAV